MDGWMDGFGGALDRLFFIGSAINGRMMDGQSGKERMNG
jgi:hypothetical protein